MTDNNVEITSLEEGKAKIAELERKFAEAVDIILKRDAQLEAREREIMTLHERLGEHEGEIK
jgi:hypothetical protein